MAMSRSLGGRSLTRRSPMWISPAVISSRPATIRRVVDLPHPDGPTRTMNSLSRMCRFTSLTAWTSSYFLLRSFSRTWAIVVSPHMEPRSRVLRALGDARDAGRRATGVPRCYHLCEFAVDRLDLLLAPLDRRLEVELVRAELR